MPDEVKLLPCPFCGQLPMLNSLGHVHHVADGCFLHDGGFTVEQWNTRAIEATRPPIGTDER